MSQDSKKKKIHDGPSERPNLKETKEKSHKRVYCEEKHTQQTDQKKQRNPKAPENVNHRKDRMKSTKKNR